jgi:hypothetical protein
MGPHLQRNAEKIDRSTRPPWFAAAAWSNSMSELKFVRRLLVDTIEARPRYEIRIQRTKGHPDRSKVARFSHFRPAHLHRAGPLVSAFRPAYRTAFLSLVQVREHCWGNAFHFAHDMSPLSVSRPGDPPLVCQLCPLDAAFRYAYFH